MVSEQKSTLFVIALLLSMCLAACVAPVPISPVAQNTLYQTSTLNALSAGDYDGTLTVGELKQYGDFGLGTFDALDGEMIVLDGQVYQAKDDGVAYIADDALKTPFAAVIHFQTDQSLTADAPMACADFGSFLDAQLPAIDAPYAIKVSGTFASLKVRAPHKETPPYPPLTEALVDQAVFDSANVTGTMVGFRLPDYLTAINVAGYHFHFISDDHRHGGHVLDCQTNSVAVAIDMLDGVRITGLQNNAVLQAAADAAATSPAVSGQDAARSEPLTVYSLYAAGIEEPWISVIHAALVAAQGTGQITYNYSDKLGTEGEMGSTLRRMIGDSRPDIIFADAFGNEDALREVAREYPDIAFVLGSDGERAAPNISVFNSWLHEPVYLGGMLAGGLTASGTVGIVAGYSEGAVNRSVNAFAAGAQAVNPEVELLITYINSWYDLDAARGATLAQIERGADVIYAERDGVIQVAAEKGIYTIGNIVDQQELAPDYVVTSALWNMETTVQHIIAQVAAGTYAPQDLAEYMTLANGGAQLAPINEDIVGGIPTALLAQVESRRAEIVSGNFQVPKDDSQPTSISMQPQFFPDSALSYK